MNGGAVLVVLANNQGVPGALSFSDSLALSDAVSINGAQNLVFPDSLVLSDAVSINGAQNLVFSDSLVLSDSIRIGAEQGLSFTDSLVLFDTVVINGAGGTSIPLVFSDTLSLVDTVFIAAPVALQFSDTLVLQDAVSLSSTNSNTISRTIYFSILQFDRQRVRNLARSLGSIPDIHSVTLNTGTFYIDILNDDGTPFLQVPQSVSFEVQGQSIPMTLVPSSLNLWEGTMPVLPKGTGDCLLSVDMGNYNLLQIQPFALFFN